MRLSVVIVNYNTGSFLKACIKSIEDKFSYIDYEIIVVDNASTDSSQLVVKEQASLPDSLFNRRKLIDAGGNIGFAAGCNLGVENSSGELILLLNPDVLILSDGIEDLLNNFQNRKGAGLLGCQNRLPSGKIQTTCYSFPTLTLLTFFVFKFGRLLSVSLVKKIFGLLFGSRWGQFSKHNEAAVVDWVTGAFMLIKRDVWEKVGQMDEQFFIFCEEIDYCKRVKEAGYDVTFEPSFEIEHHIGGSSADVPFVVAEKFRSYKLYFKKHHTSFISKIASYILWKSAMFWLLFYFVTINKKSTAVYLAVLERLRDR